MALERDKRPSALDSPRFFDDAALSGWKVGVRGSGSQVAAPKRAFESAKAYARAGADGASSPDARHDGDPIPIEFVRGANGPSDDSWTVVVDGLRCELTPLGDGTFGCQLPRGVPLEVITTETKVRPVSIAVRLEDEAELPLSAEVYLTQIVESTERVDSGNKEDVEKQLGDRIPMQPYRTTDVTVKAVTMPYPFWAPAQSALGILSLLPLNRQKEREAAALWYNAFAAVMNAAEQGAYQSQKRVYEKFKTTDWISGNVAEAARLVSNLVNDVTPDMQLSQQELNVFRLKLKAPKKPTKRAPSLVRPPSGDEADSYVIGGKKHSAVAELTEMFTHIVNVCERLRGEAREAKKQLSLRQQLGYMRFALKNEYEADEETAALFDALFDADPHPPVQLLLNMHVLVDTDDDAPAVAYDERKALTSEFRRKYIVYECTEEGIAKEKADAEARAKANDPMNIGNERIGAAIGATIGADAAEPVDEPREVLYAAAGALDDKVRKKFIEDNNKYIQDTNARMMRILNGEEKPGDKKATPKPWGGKDYQFVYDRMLLAQRQRTTLHTRIHVHIVNFDGTVLKVQFESSKEDGIVAHAVYSEYRREVEEFDIVAQKLTNCLFDVYAQPQSGLNAAKDLVSSAFDEVANRIFGKYALRRKRVKSPFFGNIFDVVKYATYDQIENLARGMIADAPFKVDPCHTEERIAELRLMARETLPIWPPMPEQVPPPTDIDASEVPDAAEVLAAAASEVPAAAAAPATEPPKSAEEAAKEAAEDAAREEAAKRQALENGKVNRADLEPTPYDELSSIYPTFSPEEQETASSFETRLVIRELPQIVVPGAALALSFQGYDFDEGFVLVESGQDRPASRFGQWVSKTGRSVALWSTVATVQYVIATKVFQWALRYKTAQQRTAAFATFMNILIAGSLPVNWATAAGVGLIQSGILKATGGLIEVAFNPLNWTLPVSWATSGMVSKWSINQLLDAWAQAKVTVPFAANMAELTVTFANREAELSKRYAGAYEKLQHRLVKKPANSAVAAGRTALRKLSYAIEKLRNRAGVADVAAVVYNDYSGQRFVFHEYYEQTEELVQRFEELPLVHRDMEWTSVPDGNALRLFPPLDVADRMYEAESLRAMPVARTTSFTAGAPPALAATTPAELAAKAAYQELMQVVRRARRLLKGQHLMQSASATGLEIAQNAAAILRAAYGVSAGITLVDGNDIVWTCLQGSVAARLAVRHLSLFDEAEAKLLPTEREVRVDESLRFWRRPRRAVMDDFAKAFVDEAAYVARQERVETPRVLALRDLSTDAARTFARASTLVLNKPGADKLEKVTVLAVVASSMAHGLVMNDPRADDFDGRIANMVAVAEPGANAFDDQRALELPKPSSYGSDLNQMTWASRRIAPSISRSIVIGADGGGGAQDIIERLAALDVSDSCGDSTTTRSYYCPMGGRIEALPGSMPFAVDNLGSRIVWMEVLQQNARFLARAIVQASNAPPVPDGPLFIDTVPLSSGVTNDTKPPKLTGMGRHPLVIQQIGSVIYVPTSFTPDAKQANFSDDVPSSLLDAMRWLQTEDDKDIPSVVRARVRHMRTVAFNAERLMFALALSRATAACAPRVEVRLRGANQVASFALALAMLEVEMGSVPAEIGVYVDDVAAARSYAEAVATQAEKALASNCRVCSLAEAALCL
jgi:hypothetical protein